MVIVKKGLVWNWIQCISKATFFLTTGTFKFTPDIADEWRVIMYVAMYFIFTTYNDLQTLRASRSVISKVAMLPKFAWLAYYKVLFFIYFPIPNENETFIIFNTINFLIGIIYTILSIIIPTLFIIDFIPIINVYKKPIRYILEPILETT